jgi:hypothetical protein
MEARLAPVGGPEEAAPDLSDAAADAVVYFARLGDRDRFVAQSGPALRVMSYARDADALASGFGRVRHAAMASLKAAVDATIFGAARVEITCPLGTRLIGRPPAYEGDPPDVAIRRFPLCMPAPVDADAFEGEVAIARWLTSTGNHAYAPSSASLDAPVRAEIAGGRVRGLRGRARDVETVRRHHQRVGALFGVDGARVHSWHAGLHPGCAYRRPASEDPERWSNSAFAHPRLLHFHTCGDAAPGEISWMVADATVTLDGVVLWRDGRLDLEAHPRTAAVLEAHPELAAAFAATEDAIGL